MAKTILILEDDKPVADILKFNLEQDGHQVEVAASGLEGLRRMREQPPDLLVLDIMMPDLDGWEVLDKLQTDETLSRVPVVVITALDDAFYVRMGWKSDIHCYITKPFDIEEVLAFTRRVLEAEDQ